MVKETAFEDFEKSRRLICYVKGTLYLTAQYTWEEEIKFANNDNSRRCVLAGAL